MQSRSPLSFILPDMEHNQHIQGVQPAAVGPLVSPVLYLKPA